MSHHASAKKMITLATRHQVCPRAASALAGTTVGVGGDLAITEENVSFERFGVYKTFDMKCRGAIQCWLALINIATGHCHWQPETYDQSSIKLLVVPPN